MRTTKESMRTSHESVPVRTRADTLIQKIGSPSNYVAKVRQRANSLHQASSARAQAQASAPALPPLPPTKVPQSSLDSSVAAENYGSGLGMQTHPETLMQQRIFIGNMQRFAVVEIGSRTNTREVLADVIAAGNLSPEEVGSGEWMLFEIANDFGMGE